VQESSEHAAIIELFRDDPQLAARLLADIFSVATPTRCARVADPVQRPATLIPDLVIELGDPISLVVIVEVQRRIDLDKRYTWPAYQWLERLRRRCPCILLVIAPDPAVAAWAAQPITSGAGNMIHPLVLGPDQIPHITDPAQALKHPALALLSARAHGHRDRDLASFRAAIAALSGLDTVRRRMYIDLVFGGIRPDRARQIKEELMLEGYNLDDLFPPAPWPTPGGDAFITMVLEALEPRAKAIARARVKAEVEAEVKAEVAAEIKAEIKAEVEADLKADLEARERQTLLLRLLARRNISLTPAQRATIEACTAVPQLDQWFDRAITVADADALFTNPLCTNDPLSPGTAQ
jgi:hypothetical protein